MVMLSADLTTETPEEENHRNFFEVIIDFWIEGFNLLKYLFYDLLLGKKPE